MKPTKLHDTGVRRIGVGHHARAGLLAAMLLALPSCFTMAVWGVEARGSNDTKTERDDSERAWSWGRFGFRILLTPIALCLDCLTAPLQVSLRSDNDDDS